MKIKGKFLGRGIIYLIFFIGFVWAEWGLEEALQSGINGFFFLITMIILTIFFGWRFIYNMEEAFK